MSRRNVHFTTQVSGEGPVLPPQLVEVLRAQLPTVADRAVGAIIEEVPTYTGAFAGPMGDTIRNAVQFALGGFLTLASRAASGPMSAAIEGAYQLGRGEARSGRSAEALLSAYRIGARVSWRDMSQAALHSGIEAAQLSRTNCQPPRWPDTPTNCKAAAGSANATSNALPARCSPTPTRKASSPLPNAPSGCRPLR